MQCHVIKDISDMSIILAGDICRSQYSDEATGWTTEWTRFGSRYDKRFFSFVFRSVLTRSGSRGLSLRTVSGVK